MGSNKLNLNSRALQPNPTPPIHTLHPLPPLAGFYWGVGNNELNFNSRALLLQSTNGRDLTYISGGPSPLGGAKRFEHDMK